MYSKGSTIDYNWFVQTREDVADFQVEIRPLLPQQHQDRPTEAPQPDLVNPAVMTKEVGYGLRADRIVLRLETDPKPDASRYAVCIRARTSTGQLRPWKPNQCQKVVSNSAGFISGSMTLFLSILLYLAIY